MILALISMFFILFVCLVHEKNLKDENQDYSVMEQKIQILENIHVKL